MCAKSIRLVARHRPSIANEEQLRVIQGKLGSIGYRISITDLEIIWTNYSKKIHPTPYYTDDGKEWAIAKAPEAPHQILQVIQPFVFEA